MEKVAGFAHFTCGCKFFKSIETPNLCRNLRICTPIDEHAAQGSGVVHLWKGIYIRSQL